MTLLKYNSDFDSLMPGSFTKLMDRFFNESVNSASKFNLNKFTPSVDVAETGKAYEVHLSVPGMKKEDFKIEINDRNLTVSGERKFEEEKKEKNFHSVETQYGKFNRSFYLPDNVDGTSIEASYQDGILNISIPKDEKKEVKNTVEVK